MHTTLDLNQRAVSAWTVSLNYNNLHTANVHYNRVKGYLWKYTIGYKPIYAINTETLNVII
jgi:hypothetical protein